MVKDFYNIFLTTYLNIVIICFSFLFIFIWAVAIFVSLDRTGLLIIYSL